MEGCGTFGKCLNKLQYDRRDADAVDLGTLAIPVRTHFLQSGLSSSKTDPKSVTGIIERTTLENCRLLQWAPSCCASAISVCRMQTTSAPQEAGKWRVMETEGHAKVLTKQSRAKMGLLAAITFNNTAMECSGEMCYIIGEEDRQHDSIGGLTEAQTRSLCMCWSLWGKSQNMTHV